MPSTAVAASAFCTSSCLMMLPSLVISMSFLSRMDFAFTASSLNSFILFCTDSNSRAFSFIVTSCFFFSPSASAAASSSPRVNSPTLWTSSFSLLSAFSAAMDAVCLVCLSSSCTAIICVSHSCSGGVSSSIFACITTESSASLSSRSAASFCSRNSWASDWNPAAPLWASAADRDFSLDSSAVRACSCATVAAWVLSCSSSRDFMVDDEVTSDESFCSRDFTASVCCLASRSSFSLSSRSFLKSDSRSWYFADLMEICGLDNSTRCRASSCARKVLGFPNIRPSLLYFLAGVSLERLDGLLESLALRPGGIEFLRENMRRQSHLCKIGDLLFLYADNLLQFRDMILPNSPAPFLQRCPYPSRPSPGTRTRSFQSIVGRCDRCLPRAP